MSSKYDLANLEAITLYFKHHSCMYFKTEMVWDVVALETPTNTCHCCLSVVCAVGVRGTEKSRIAQLKIDGP
jgi:hypothetical protein